MITLFILQFWCPFKNAEDAWTVVVVELLLDVLFTIAVAIALF